MAMFNSGRFTVELMNRGHWRRFSQNRSFDTAMANARTLLRDGMGDRARVLDESADGHVSLHRLWPTEHAIRLVRRRHRHVRATVAAAPAPAPPATAPPHGAGEQIVLIGMLGGALALLG